jgi:dTDP-4-amino-4,6-dideoxygalactose transaminase
MMPDTFLSFSPPLTGQEEINEVVDTLRNGWITTGPKVKRFEEEFAAYLGSDAAVALNSGTAAPRVALATLDKTVHRPKSSKGTTIMKRKIGTHTIFDC